MATVQDVIKNYIVGEIFYDYPIDLETNPYDFFLEADVDCTNFVSETSLGTKWGYEVCSNYELDNVRAIRGAMESMYNDLERLKSALFQEVTEIVKINKNEIANENVFYNIAQYSNAMLKEQGSDSEYITFITVSEEALS